MTRMQRGVLIAAAAAAYGIGLWPSWWLRDLVRSAFGNPAYEDIWILIPHLFLYTTLPALFCFVAWSILARLQWMPALRLSPHLTTIGWGLGAGLASVAIILAFFFATGQAGAFHTPRIDPWIAAANVFSNFYEEYVFRGFILAALAAALGFWPAAIISSVAFAATHTQYPLSFQAMIAAIALLWAWVGKRGLLAPYAAHMTLDWLLDPIL